MNRLVVLAIGAVLWGMATVACSGNDVPGEDQVTAEDLAVCLAESGFTLYGSSWDSETEAQAWAFGEGFSSLKYVRCDEPVGSLTEISEECRNAGIQYLPTWVDEISGNAYFGSFTLRKLAALSGCETPVDWLEKPKFALADCLNDQGATLYGTTWCHYCKVQLEEFGAAVDEIDYVICDDPDDAYFQKQVCKDLNIIAYPTWVFEDGGRILGAYYLWGLADITGCEWPERPDFNL